MISMSSQPGCGLSVSRLEVGKPDFDRLRHLELWEGKDLKTV
jgi:hypothetical protein